MVSTHVCEASGVRTDQTALPVCNPVLGWRGEGRVDECDKENACGAGMKRRLSVAISLIGSPRVAYLDEPSTGLDPASRRQLWDVVQRAKQDKAIVLTTHSMEEAEGLCDRLGIFIDGRLVCLGNPKHLTARYGGYYVRTPLSPPPPPQPSTTTPAPSAVVRNPFSWLLRVSALTL